MDRFAKSLAEIFARLRNTSLSQRVALALGGLLVAVSLIWLTQWAATPEMVPLLEMDLAPEQIAQIRDGLGLMGESHEVRGARVYVRSTANRAALQAQLQLQDRLPADTSSSFDALVKESNPWISQAESDRRWNHALEAEIANVLRQFEGVKSATVFLPAGSPRRAFSRNEAAATASVTLVMKNGQPVSRNLALAVAKLVSGAVRGLPVQNVQVVNAAGESCLNWDEEDSASGGLHRERLRQEKLIAEKIRGQIADPKARVSVQVEMDLTTREIYTDTPIEGVEITSDSTTERVTRAKRGGQPGPQPNVGIEAGAGGGTDESQERESSQKSFKPGAARKTEQTPPGMISQVSAAVNISHGYLLSILKRRDPAAAAGATDEQIQEVFESEKKRLLSQVTKLVKPQKDDRVAIDWYYDAEDAPTSAPAGAIEEGVELAKRYGPPAGLGALALISLFMMLRMAKRTSAAESFGLELGLPKEAIDAARQAAEDVSKQAQRMRTAKPASAVAVTSGGVGATGTLVEVTPQSVGHAAATEGVLVAKEVDESQVQTHKMIEQVVQMVEQDPDAVAGLFEQWIQRHEQLN
jgi:flagellar biosynthesis/type III secretory pathway M-ring protein FliF/YscJ